MKRAHDRHGYKTMHMILAAAAVFLLATSASVSGGEAPSGTVVLTARFPADTEEISGIFKRSLPDSGVVPVAVTVANETDTTVIIHTASGLELGGNINGFSLVTGGGSHLPIHPMEALMRALAAEKGIKYRKPGFWGLTLGILVVPPLAFYYAYKEAVSGRFYRPIFNNSLYPSQPNWSMSPIEIAPGGEVEGFLYFVLPPQQNPYPVADSTAVDSTGGDLSFELHMSACVRPARADTIPLDELLTVRDDRGGWGGGGSFVALRRSGTSRRKRTLVIGSVTDLGRRPYEELEEAAGVAAKSATIADASERGQRTACALNFKSKSKIYLVDRRSDPVSVTYRGFDRKIKRVFVVDDGLIALTENGFCHYLTGEKLKTKRRVNFPRGFEDAVILDEHLHVLHRSGMLYVYGLNGDALLKEIGRFELAKGKAKIVGSCSGELVLLREGSRIAGDTLIFVDREDMERAALLMAPGRVAHASCNNGQTILQLENGIILLLLWTDEGSYTIEKVFYAPFAVKTLYYEADEVAAIGAGGTVMVGRSEDFLPGADGVHDAAVGVELPHVR